MMTEAVEVSLPRVIVPPAGAMLMRLPAAFSKLTATPLTFSFALEPSQIEAVPGPGSAASVLNRLVAVIDPPGALKLPSIVSWLTDCSEIDCPGSTLIAARLPMLSVVARINFGSLEKMFVGETISALKLAPGRWVMAELVLLGT